MNTIDRGLKRARREVWLATKRWRQRAAASVLGARQKHAIFVTGVQRSGTNMVMDLLEADLATEVFHETDRRAFDNYELRSPETLASLIDATAAPVTVFKALCECQDIKTLLNRVVGSRCIWVYRHYENVAASHSRKWTGMPATIRALCDGTNDASDWRGAGMSGATRDVLKAHVHDDLNNESACALFWYLRNQLLFDQRLNEDPRVRLLNYERLLAGAHEYTAAIFVFVGLEYVSGAGEIIQSPPARSRQNKHSLIDAPVQKLCDEMFQRLQAEPHLQAITDTGKQAPAA